MCLHKSVKFGSLTQIICFIVLTKLEKIFKKNIKSPIIKVGRNCEELRPKLFSLTIVGNIFGKNGKAH